jgi:hypothetical protein
MILYILFVIGLLICFSVGGLGIIEGLSSNSMLLRKLTYITILIVVTIIILTFINLGV